MGRHPSCDARLDSLRVSRHHCCISHEDGELFVRDLGSTNGVRINGERVKLGRLRMGDELSIAHFRYRFEQGPDWRPPRKARIASLPFRRIPRSRISSPGTVDSSLSAETDGPRLAPLPARRCR